MQFTLRIPQQRQTELEKESVPVRTTVRVKNTRKRKYNYQQNRVLFFPTGPHWKLNSKITTTNPLLMIMLLILKNRLPYYTKAPQIITQQVACIMRQTSFKTFETTCTKSSFFSSCVQTVRCLYLRIKFHFS